jgi:hypothetical protein
MLHINHKPTHSRNKFAFQVARLNRCDHTPPPDAARFPRGAQTEINVSNMQMWQFTYRLSLQTLGLVATARKEDPVS